MSADTLNHVRRLVEPLRAQNRRMIGVRDVMQLTGRRDRKCTRELMRDQMGGFRDGNQIKVTLEALERYLTRIYEPTSDDIARDLLTRPRRTTKRKITTRSTVRKS